MEKQNIWLESHFDIRRSIPKHTFNIEQKVMSLSEFRTGDWLYVVNQSYGRHVMKLYKPKKYVSRSIYMMDYHLVIYGHLRDHNYNSARKTLQNNIDNIAEMLRGGMDIEEAVGFQLL